MDAVAPNSDRVDLGCAEFKAKAHRYMAEWARRRPFYVLGKGPAGVVVAMTALMRVLAAVHLKTHRAACILHSGLFGKYSMHAATPSACAIEVASRHDASSRRPLSSEYCSSVKADLAPESARMVSPQPRAPHGCHRCSRLDFADPQRRNAMWKTKRTLRVVMPLRGATRSGSIPPLSLARASVSTASPYPRCQSDIKRADLTVESLRTSAPRSDRAGLRLAVDDPSVMLACLTRPDSRNYDDGRDHGISHAFARELRCQSAAEKSALWPNGRIQRDAT